MRLRCCALASVQLASSVIIEHNHSDEHSSPSEHRPSHDPRPSGYDYIKNIKAAIEFDLRDKRVVKCYQCVYSPPRYETKMVPRRRRDGHTDLVNITKEIQGGWAPCKGPFSRSEARRSGIDAGHCLSNCYTRLDHLGNMLRGCYRGEYGVNPNKTGCHQQAGYIYCFCEGDRCNNHLPSSLPDSEEKNEEADVRRVQKVYNEPYERGRVYSKGSQYAASAREYSQPKTQRNIYNLRYRDRPASSSRSNAEKAQMNRYRPTPTSRYSKPKTREYHDKNSYTLINSQYEKEVKEDDQPSTRYRSVAEFGREAPSSDTKEKQQPPYSNKQHKQYDRYTVKTSPYRHKSAKGFGIKENKRESPIYTEIDSASPDLLRSPKRSKSAVPSDRSHESRPDSTPDRSLYKPVYHSYASDLADKYRNADVTKSKDSINRRPLFSRTNERSSGKKSQTGASGVEADDSWRKRTWQQDAQPTTQRPRASENVSPSSNSQAWDFSDEFMTQLDESDSQRQKSKWPTYNSVADDKKDSKKHDSTSWQLKKADDQRTDSNRNSQATKRQEKQGYNDRWF